MRIPTAKSIPCPVCQKKGIQSRAWHDHTVALEDKDGSMIVEGVVYLCFRCDESTMKTVTYDRDNLYKDVRGGGV